MPGSPVDINLSSFYYSPTLAALAFNKVAHVLHLHFIIIRM